MAKAKINDDHIAVYMDRPAAFVVVAPVLNDRYGLAVWVEKGSGRISGFPTALSTKVMLRSLCKRTKEKEDRHWYWQLGPLSPCNIKMERNQFMARRQLNWNNASAFMLHDYLGKWGLLEMVEDLYMPIRGPIDMGSAIASARDKYEEVLTALTQAVITGLDLPEPTEDN